METQTLDAKLRKRGYDKLNAELETAFTPMLRMFDAAGQGHHDVMQRLIPPNKQDGIPVHNVYSVVTEMKKMVFNALSESYGQREVDAFLKDVEEVKCSIESLEGEVRR